MKAVDLLIGALCVLVSAVAIRTAYADGIKHAVAATRIAEEDLTREWHESCKLRGGIPRSEFNRNTLTIDFACIVSE